jgi:hypothetical protein
MPGTAIYFFSYWVISWQPLFGFNCKGCTVISDGFRWVLQLKVFGDSVAQQFQLDHQLKVNALPELMKE